MNQDEWVNRERTLIEILKPKLTKEFLDTLVLAVRTCGWSVDYIELENFVEWCFAHAGIVERPDLSLLNPPN